MLLKIWLFLFTPVISTRENADNKGAAVLGDCLVAPFTWLPCFQRLEVKADIRIKGSGCPTTDGVRFPG